MEKIQVPTFVKWAGGKTRLLQQFEQYLPDKIDRYFEPFVGSGAVFLYIKKTRKPTFCMISDNNQDLMNLYGIVRDNVEELLEILTEYKKKHMKRPKEFYYEQRKQFNSDKLNRESKTLEKSALLIYLNKTCFNGLYRVNSEGKFNVPFGKYKNPGIVQQDRLEEASDLLQDVEIKTMHFKNIIKYTEQEDFIYFDPPYQPLSKTSSFTSYTSDAFSEKDQKELYNYFKKLDKKGCRIMLSNSYSPLIKELYRHYNLNVVMASRAINCKGEGRGKIKELLITDYHDSRPLKDALETTENISLSL